MGKLHNFTPGWGEYLAIANVVEETAKRVANRIKMMKDEDLLDPNDKIEVARRSLRKLSEVIAIQQGVIDEYEAIMAKQKQTREEKVRKITNKFTNESD